MKKLCFKKNNNIILRFIYIVFLIMLAFYGSDCFYTITTFHNIFGPQAIGVFILGSGFVLALFFFLMGIFKSSFKSGIITMTILFIFYFINQLRVCYTDLPISYYDFDFLKTGGEITNIISGTITSTIMSFIGFLFIYIFSLLFVGFFLKREKLVINDFKTRLFCITGSIFYIAVLLNPTIGFKDFLLNSFYNVNSRNDYDAFVDMKGYCRRYGMIGGIYGEFLESITVEPDGYNIKEIDKLVSVENNAVKDFGKPNVIVLFSESFFDIDLIDEVKFDKLITSNFNRLKNEGIFFDMISPSYGGISANVEFQFLTGAILMYFNKGYTPYLQLYRDDTYYNRPSIINELNKNGYRTMMNVYTSAELFECGRFYDYVGVDEAYFRNKLPKKYKKGKYVSDKYVVDQIISDFNNKGDEKVFNMSLTMQAHMPYSIDKYKKYDFDVVDSKLNTEKTNIIKSYAQGVYDADKELGRLYDYIKTLDEDTMIIFYGDHLPYLKTNSGKNIMDELKYFNTGIIYNNKCNT